MENYMTSKTVLVTGANGYIGNAVAKAFRRAGWKTFGLIRRSDDAADLARHEIHPVLGSPDDLSFVSQFGEVAFDVIVSNTEDTSNPSPHFAKVRTMLDTIAGRGCQASTRPLVMFTSGCKDYGNMALKDGDAGLAPHTEGSPLNPPAPLVPRCDFGISLMSAKYANYDATVLRPTIVYGNSSSHYGSLFDLAASSDSVLLLMAVPGAIMHSLHVDDCGDAYVSLAEHPRRDEVVGHAFNISNARYETAQQIGDALARAYGLTLAFEAPTGDGQIGRGVHSLANFWQWVGSAKLRELTGWTECRPTFVQGIDEYRLAYEARRASVV
jgi:nucleoside-diphosphate-sugar epimerase